MMNKIEGEHTHLQFYLRRARVRAAFFAAADLLRGPFVFAALRAEAERSEADLFLAAACACLESAVFDADLRGSSFKRFTPALERFREIGSCRCPFSYARFALLRVVSEVSPFPGGLRSTPARLALDSPIAIACLADFAPCLPSRMCRISSCTNSPACVDGDLPSRLSFCARLIVFFSGI